MYILRLCTGLANRMLPTLSKTGQQWRDKCLICIKIFCRQLRQIKSPLMTCLPYAYTVYAHMLDYFSEYLSVIIGELTKTCTTGTNRHRFRSYTRHYVMVGTYDKIKVRTLQSHCMHTCLIISLHGVVLFFGDYIIHRQIYVHM